MYKRQLGIVLGAAEANKWSEADTKRSRDYAAKMHEAFRLCHEGLPELLRKIKKVRKGPSLVDPCQEPSHIVLQFVLQQESANPPIPQFVAIFLSNLQKFPLEKWPAILAPQECKKLYTQLFSNPVKVKEALGKFANDGSEGAVIPVLTLSLIHI